MSFLGLDISDRRTIGVVVDENGDVVRRTRREEESGGAAAVAREIASGLSIEAFGVASEATPVASLKIRNLPPPNYVMPGAAIVTT